jgi:hypothetical protein
MLASAVAGSCEVLEREARQDHVERGRGERAALAAQVDLGKLVELDKRCCRGMDVGSDQPADAGAERAELGRVPAARIERGDATLRGGWPCLGVGDRGTQRATDERGDGWRHTESLDDRLPTRGRHPTTRPSRSRLR